MDWYYSKNGERFGPFDTPKLKQLAASGAFEPSDLIWREGFAEWVQASRIKGLFAQTAPPLPPIPSALPASAPVQPTNAMAPPNFTTSTGAQTVAYATPGSIANSGSPLEMPLRRRSVLPFTIIAGLMFIVGSTVAYKAYFDRPTMADQKQMIVAASETCGFILLAIPALILWLIWIHGMHRDLKSLSGGQYSISPGQAVGFSFIPAFDAFWAIYMPWRACGEINQHLRSRGLAEVSRGGVLACQIGSVVTALALPSLLPVLYAASMWQLQAGMNRLVSVPLS